MGPRNDTLQMKIREARRQLSILSAGLGDFALSDDPGTRAIAATLSLLVAAFGELLDQVEQLEAQRQALQNRVDELMQAQTISNN